MLERLDVGSLSSGREEEVYDPADQTTYARPRRQDVVTVPVMLLQPGDSPRLEGEDTAHIERLAEADTPVPPILVDRRSMRVIDGMHRLMAASLMGRTAIEVEFFDGSSADAFLRAVEANVTHGLPLSQEARRAAVTRIMLSHPQMSDRAIARSTGLAARTVAGIRLCSTDAVQQLNARVGRDGRVRPLSGTEGRRRAAELIAERPGASLREVAKHAGISPATVRDVRLRLERGEEPAVTRPNTGHRGKDWARQGRAARPGVDRGDKERAGSAHSVQSAEQPDPISALEKLLRDPSLRNNDRGRNLLRLLQHTAVATKARPGVMTAVPPHCSALVLLLARHYAQIWLSIANELEERMRVMENVCES